MIFVTVGTHHQPFQRLLAALDSLDDPAIVVQYGTGTPPAAATEACSFMQFDQILGYMESADVVIMHAGVGSILCATRLGHTPVVVPRRSDLGEHVDDHQVDLTCALASRGRIVPIWETERLASGASAAPARRSRPAFASGPLHVRLREAILNGQANDS